MGKKWHELSCQPNKKTHKKLTNVFQDQDKSDFNKSSYNDNQAFAGYLYGLNLYNFMFSHDDIRNRFENMCSKV